MNMGTFHRKLADRGIQITGQGSRAEVKNRVLIPRLVSNGGGVDWGTISLVV